MKAISRNGRIGLDNYIDGTATCLCPENNLGRHIKIWQHVVIQPDVIVGDDCKIGANSFIENGVSIGNNVTIKNNVAIYTGVTIEDDVFLGPSCVFTNVINPRSFISRKHELRSTLIKRGATIGANATIICGHVVGRYAMVGAGSVVTKDVPDFALVVGNPARKVGYVCECGCRLVAGDNAKKREGNLMHYHCMDCGRTYDIHISF